MAIAPVGPAGLKPVGDEFATTGPARPGEGPFSKVIDQLLGGANNLQAQADKAVEDLALGRTDNVHGVMLAVARADLSFRMILEVRNRLTEAMQDVMRMQV